MRMIKLIIKYLFYGISCGCTFFVVSCLFLYLAGGENNLMPIVQNFAAQAIGAMLTGIACASTSVIYQFEKIPMRYKILVHFVIGMGTYYLIAIYLKWIPFYPEKIEYTVVQILIAFGIFAAIWLIFFLFEYIEAKNINQKLKELEKDNLK